MTAGVGTAAAIASLVADAGQWTTRLSREARSVVTTSSNLGDLFRRARTAIDDLATTAEHGPGLPGRTARHGHGRSRRHQRRQQEHARRARRPRRRNQPQQRHRQHRRPRRR